MTHDAMMRTHPVWRALRWAVWGGSGLLLLLPLLAMRIDGSGVDWTGFDFVAMASLLLLPCLAFEAAMRVGRSHAYVLGCLVASAAAFGLIWVNLAVGIVGGEDNPVNLAFFAVPAVALAGAAWSRLRAARLAHAMHLTALVQAVGCVAALVLGGPSVFAATAVFLLLWLAAAQLFRHAARGEHAAA